MLSRLHTELEARIGWLFASGVSSGAISQDCHHFSPWKWKNIEKHYPFSTQTQISRLSTNVPKSLPIIVDWVPTWEKPMVSFFSAVVRSFGFSSTPTKWQVGTFHQWLRLQFGGLYRIQFEKWALEVLQWDQSSAVCLFQWDGLLLHFETHPKTVQLQASPLVWHFARARPCLDSEHSCCDSSVWEN